MFTWEENRESKKQMIKSYKTQAKAIFPGGHIPLIPEIYYSPKK
jgi:hypothetical protein